MVYVGIDPGKNGAIAIIEPNKFSVIPMPLVGKEYDAKAIFSLLSTYSLTNCFVVLERAQAMPKQGVVSMFEFGKGYGIIIGILEGLGLPYQIVHSRVWTNELLKGIDGEGKERAVRMAHRLFGWSPKKKKEYNYADALLLAEYGRRKCR